GYRRTYGIGAGVMGSFPCSYTATRRGANSIHQCRGGTMSSMLAFAVLCYAGLSVECRTPHMELSFNRHTRSPEPKYTRTHRLCEDELDDVGTAAVCSSDGRDPAAQRSNLSK
ncbi:unnamed protein product, partial [Sphacelaria rigidula]